MFVTIACVPATVTQVLSAEGRYLPKGHTGRVKMASTVQRDPVGSISAFVIVLIVIQTYGGTRIRGRSASS